MRRLDFWITKVQPRTTALNRPWFFRFRKDGEGTKVLGREGYPKPKTRSDVRRINLGVDDLGRVSAAPHRFGVQDPSDQEFQELFRLGLFKLLGIKPCRDIEALSIRVNKERRARLGSNG